MHVYQCLPMLTCVNLCLPLFTRACLLMVTHVYSCLPMFTYGYHYLLVLAYVTIVEQCLPLFTRFYPCLIVFTSVHQWLLVFTYVYHVYSFIFTYFVPIFTRAHLWLHLFTYFYPCCLVFTYVYLCLPMFATVYSCLLMFTTVYSCMFPYVQHYQWIHGRVTLYFKTNVLFCVAVSRSKLSSDKRCLSLRNFSACWENIPLEELRQEYTECQKLLESTNTKCFNCKKELQAAQLTYYLSWCHQRQCSNHNTYSY